MSSFKEILFGKYAGVGLNSAVEEMQKKYSKKKGRRFNHDNITYEISRGGVVDESMQFEVSSKIPQDEVKNDKDMKSYFTEIKKLATKFTKKPVSIEMENIVLDTNRNTEKERDYVKLLYRYPLNNLYSDKEMLEKTEKMLQNKSKLNPRGALTEQGNVALQLVQETTQNFARQNIEDLISANKKVRIKIKG
jgi:hypothetical protein